jgi:hypothetical protein
VPFTLGLTAQVVNQFKQLRIHLSNPLIDGLRRPQIRLNRISRILKGEGDEQNGLHGQVIFHSRAHSCLQSPEGSSVLLVLVSLPSTTERPSGLHHFILPSYHRSAKRPLFVA